MKATLTLSGALVLALAGAGYADLTFATGAAGFLLGTDTGTAQTSAGTNAVAGHGDGIYFFVYGNTVGDDYTVTIAFAPGTDTEALTIYSGYFTSIVNLTNVQWTGGSTPGNQNVNVPMLSAVGDGSNAKTSVLGLGWSTDFTGLVLKFTTQIGAGDNTTYTIDAISNLSANNPEPESMALFAVGIAGLGALAWRRRRTRRVARAAQVASANDTVALWI
ncbi:MAG: PEP-CTERM sorting domain-containing protein [Planctomycetes bacterium]|nr:PEP-CTERM sorting domain-containing protein [Planctomycetota bacterium]